MPTIKSIIPEVHKTCIRPAAIEVVKDVLKVLRIDEKITPVEYNGALQNFAPRNSTLDKEAENVFETKQRVRINLNDEYVDRAVMSTPIYNQDHPCIFIDPDMQVFVYPVKQTREFSIDIQLFAPDRVTAGRWVRNLKSLISSTVYNNLHDVTFSYNIPLEVMQFLIDIHNRGEMLKPYNRKIADWFKDKFTKNFTFVTDQAGKNVAPVIAENQIKILGHFGDGVTVPREEPDAEGSGGWVTSLSYKFWMDIPEEMVMVFPLMTHQQLLSEKYINYELPEWVDILRSNSSASAQIYKHFDSAYQYSHPLDITPGIPIPTCDDWRRPNIISPSYTDILRILIQMEEGNPEMCNLVDLDGNFAIYPRLLEYMKQTFSKMTGRLYNNIFHCTVWRWDQLQRFEEVRVDADLNVFFDGPVELRDNYHLCVHMLTDPSLLTDDAIKDLGQDSCAVYEYFKLLFPKYIDKYMKKPTTCGPIDPGVIKEVIKEIDKDKDLMLYPRAPLPVTVGQFTIIAGDRE